MKNLIQFHKFIYLMKNTELSKLNLSHKKKWKKRRWKYVKENFMVRLLCDKEEG